VTDAAWDALLTRFEEDLAGSAAAGPWTPPDAPLPAECADRARALVTRQQERMRQLRDELADVRVQLGALRRVPPVRGDAPALLDLDL
jgi:hypothetical protein